MRSVRSCMRSLSAGLRMDHEAFVCIYLLWGRFDDGVDWMGELAGLYGMIREDGRLHNFLDGLLIKSFSLFDKKASKCTWPRDPIGVFPIAPSFCGLTLYTYTRIGNHFVAHPLQRRTTLSALTRHPNHRSRGRAIPIKAYLGPRDSIITPNHSRVIAAPSLQQGSPSCATPTRLQLPPGVADAICLVPDR